MIVTVTLNAALDRTLTVPIFQVGHRHRASEALVLAGGKGINVARALKRLDVPVIDYLNIPKVTYCTPEIASVGLTEEQAREAGLDVVVDTVDFRAIGKANMLGEGGIIKLVAEADGPVRGVHMVGPHVTDLIAEGMLIVNWEALPAEVAAMMHPHPTLSEGIGEAHLALAGKPLHSP